ncbi:phage portal protein [Xanthomonas albilineans]|uniref:phage portal protein n=1 Tax=Xanthomonas albilineans TaxID=29447 RepID=UPI00069614F8|nr:phage portal protein [Xanthomonas albilineans]
MGRLADFLGHFGRARADANDRSAWGSFWFEPVTVRTTSGARISSESALRLSAVYACVRILAESMASLPFILYRPNHSGGKVEVTDHWLYRLFHIRPNRYQNPFEWREMLMGHLALRGNAFCRILSDAAGQITDLIPIHPDRVSLVLSNTQADEYSYRMIDRFGNQTILPRGAVWHLRGLSSDGMIGLSPIEMARESVGLALTAQEYGSRFFANDAKPTGGWIEYPGTFKDKPARDNFRESYQHAQGTMNRGKVLVLEAGMKYHEVGVTNKEAQFLELRKFQVTDIARLFRVPPHMIADLDRATNNNIEQQSIEFVRYTMRPWAERWEASIRADLMLDEEDMDCEFDFAALMRGDANSRATYYSAMVSMGALTRNEVRVAENYAPLPGLDEPLVALNMGATGPNQQPTPTQAPPDDDNAEPSKINEQDDDDET